MQANCLVEVVGDIWIADSQGVVTCYNTNLLEIVSPRQESKRLALSSKNLSHLRCRLYCALIIVSPLFFNEQARSISWP
jgi:hypothetical protein